MTAMDSAVRRIGNAEGPPGAAPALHGWRHYKIRAFAAVRRIGTTPLSKCHSSLTPFTASSINTAPHVNGPALLGPFACDC